MDIIVKCWQWARSRGYNNFHDRRYYLSPVDVQNICQTYRQQKRYCELKTIHPFLILPAESAWHRKCFCCVTNISFESNPVTIISLAYYHGHLNAIYLLLVTLTHLNSMYLLVLTLGHLNAIYIH